MEGLCRDMVGKYSGFYMTHVCALKLRHDEAVERKSLSFGINLVGERSHHHHVNGSRCDHRITCPHVHRQLQKDEIRV